MPKKLTKEQFIEKAKQIHGNKYDYSKVEYKNTDIKVCIICSEHGEFYQTPHDHLGGHGCPSCGGTHVLTTKEFIEKAKRIHGDKYDYSKTCYKNKLTKVCIICPEHGEFWQIPRDHLSGCGCQQCAGFVNSYERMNTETFIERAKYIHGDKYDYSNVNYVNTKTKVCIICPEHGEFWQLPGDHIRGCNCKQCSRKSIGETKIKNILTKYSIDFVHDKAPLKFLGRMRPDFYLPDYNLVIEYDGKQHFQQLFKDSKETFEQRKQYDKIKEQLCEENGVEVLRITYLEYDNIENILIEKLNLGGNK